MQRDDACEAPPPATPMQPPAKRHRPAAPPYHRVLKAVGGQRLRVRLAAATDADMCPLTMGPASEDELDFLPGATYLPSLPHIRLMTLPCQHSFGAMSLLYHFAMHNMLCPCCRRGVGGRIAASSIPAHVRAPLMQRVEAAARLERQEQAEADASTAQLLGREGGEVVAQLLVRAGGTLQVGVILINLVEDAWATPQELLAGVALSVLVHTGDDAGPPHLCLEYRLVTSEDLDSRWPPPTDRPIRFEMPLAEQHRLVAQLADTGARRISLIAHAPCVSGRNIMLAQSDPLPVRLPEGVPHEVHLGTSRFCMHPRHGSDALSHIVWEAEARTFDPLMTWYT